MRKPTGVLVLLSAFMAGQANAQTATAPNAQQSEPYVAKPDGSIELDWKVVFLQSKYADAGISFFRIVLTRSKQGETYAAIHYEIKNYTKDPPNRPIDFYVDFNQGPTVILAHQLSGRFTRQPCNFGLAPAIVVDIPSRPLGRDIFGRDIFDWVNSATLHWTELQDTQPC